MAQWRDLLLSLVRRENLTAEDATWAMEQILSGEASQVHLAALLVGLRSKGETVTEVSAFSDTMLAKATPITLDRESVDVVGTGGDVANTVNVSTMAAIVAAGAGAQVVKHGNRAASSACGAADVLEALGVALDVPPESQPEVLAEAGVVFLFAPLYHQSMRFAGPTRSELGIPTVFNFLGPLSNPARPRAMAIGVADPRMAELMASVLAGRGARGLVFHGRDGLDELTTTTSSTVWVFTDEQVVCTEFDPARLGLAPATREALVGGAPDVNAQITTEMLAGAPGPVRDIVTLNAAAALLAFDGIDPTQSVEDQIAPHLERANEAIDSGSAAATLERWVTSSQLRRPTT